MRWKGREESRNVEDRRQSGTGRLAVGGGLGTVVLVVLFFLMGGDPRQLLQFVGQTQEMSTQSAPAVPGGAVEDEGRQFVGVVLKDTEDVWDALFRAEGNAYQPPRLVLFRDQVQSGCGVAGASAGPFYCPGDQKIYVDLGFYEQLEQQLGFQGDFAMAYVIAHEYGHHIQNLQGTLGGSRSNEDSVRVELQADCYAGAWASQAAEDGRLEAGDFDEAIGAAEAVGDDAIQGAGADRDTFTHGSSAERERWFRQGFDSADPATCRTGA